MQWSNITYDGKIPGRIGIGLIKLTGDENELAETRKELEKKIYKTQKEIKTNLEGM